MPKLAAEMSALEVIGGSNNAACGSKGGWVQGEDRCCTRITAAGEPAEVMSQPHARTCWTRGRPEAVYMSLWILDS